MMAEKETPKPPPLARLDSVEDLKRVLFMQKTIAQQVRREMAALMSTKELMEGKITGPEEVKRVVGAQARLLEKYASYPTLSEFAFHPNLAGATKWGATFGVAIMARILVVDQIKAILPQFSPVARNMYRLILQELDNPTHEYLIEPLEKALKMSVTTEDGKMASVEESKEMTRKLIYQFAEVSVVVSMQYGLVGGQPGGFVITPTGRRVLLHLVDAEVFLDQLTEAHKRFQQEQPKLSLL